MPPGDLDYFRWIYAVESAKGVVERFDEEILINQSPEVTGTAGSFRGHKGFLALQSEINESYVDVKWEPQEVLDLGVDRYLVLLNVNANGRASGVPMTAEIAHVVHLKNGKVAQIDAYLGWAKGREAVGLSE